MDNLIDWRLELTLQERLSRREAAAYLVNFNGKSRPVKNLGWLLKHWKDVDYVRITKLKEGRCWFRAFMKHPTRDKVFYYFTVWESTAHCIEWLHRPVFEGLPLVVQRFEYETHAHVTESIQVC